MKTFFFFVYMLSTGISLSAQTVYTLQREEVNISQYNQVLILAINNNNCTGCVDQLSLFVKELHSTVPFVILTNVGTHDMMYRRIFNNKMKSLFPAAQMILFDDSSYYYHKYSIDATPVVFMHKKGKVLSTISYRDLFDNIFIKPKAKKVLRGFMGKRGQIDFRRLFTITLNIDIK